SFAASRLLSACSDCAHLPLLSPKESTVKGLIAATAAVVLLAVACPPLCAADEINTGDTAWMLVATGLVLLMVPGLALFYGGMVRRKNVLGTMMHSMVALALIGIQWVLFGYSLAFGESQNGMIGLSGNLFGLNNVLSDAVFPGTHIPVYVHCMYQGMF